MPSARLLGTDLLGGFRLHFHKRSVDGSGKCTIAAPGTGVYIAVYELSRSDKLALDRIEGVGQGYSVQSIVAPKWGLCATYVAGVNDVDDSLQPYDWYKTLVMLGCSYHGFPDAYVSAIAEIKSRPDTDLARRAQNESLIDNLRPSTR